MAKTAANVKGIKKGAAKYNPAKPKQKNNKI